MVNMATGVLLYWVSDLDFLSIVLVRAITTLSDLYCASAAQPDAGWGIGTYGLFTY